MAPRPGQTSVIHSKKFVITAGIAVVITGTMLGTVAGIVPVPAWTESWTSDEASWTQEEKRAGHRLHSKTQKSGARRLAGGPKTREVKLGGSGRKPGFRRRLGRRIARFLKWAGRNRSTPTTSARQPAGQAVRGNKNNNEERGNRPRHAEARPVARGAAPTAAPEVDSTQFGVGSVGLGLQGNGGPIAAGAAPIVGGPGVADPNLSYDAYFDPVEEVPTVQVTSKKSRNSITGGARTNAGPVRDPGRAGGRTNYSREKPKEYGEVEEIETGDGLSEAEYEAQLKADALWADKKGGGDLNKHKIKSPEIGGGKAIRNAPSRTR